MLTCVFPAHAHLSSSHLRAAQLRYRPKWWKVNMGVRVIAVSVIGSQLLKGAAVYVSSS